MQISAAPKAGKGPGGTFPLLKEGTNYAKKKTVSGLFCPAGHHPFYYFFYCSVSGWVPVFLYQLEFQKSGFYRAGKLYQYT